MDFRIVMGSDKSKDCYIIVRSDTVLRSKFKEWCKSEKVTMTTAFRALMNAAVKDKFEVVHFDPIVRDRKDA